MFRTLRALALTLLIPAALAAQHPQTRQGFGISLGLGAGSAVFTCDDCPTDWGGTAPSGYLRLGGYLSPSVMLAGESNGWSDPDGASIGAILAVVQWYPMVERGLYLKGGLGYAYADALDFGIDPPSGFGASLGAGYDLRVARNFALTPYINYFRMIGGTMSWYDGDPDSSPNIGVFQFGLGFTWF